MTGPLVQVKVLQPAGGLVVLPGQSIACSGRATGSGGGKVPTITVGEVTVSVDGGAAIDAVLSQVLPKPAVPALNWTATVVAPQQPGTHQIKVIAFPDNAGAVAVDTVLFTVQPVAPPLSPLTPQASMSLTTTNPAPPGPGDWASPIVREHITDLDLSSVLDDVTRLARDNREYPVCAREWTQVIAPEEDYDTETVGFSGWLLGPDISGADVPFTHPFGKDWECQVALDTQFAGLLAAGNVEPDGNEGADAFAVAEELGIPGLLGADSTQQLGGLLGIEIESRCVPAALQPPFGELVRPGDRIAAIGRWIVDSAHAVNVHPGDSPMLPAGGTSFRSEVHPPLVMAIGGTREVAPGDIRTRIVLTSRPYLTRQVYVVDTHRIGDDTAPDDSTLLTHLHRELKKLEPDWWHLGIPDSVTIEAHPQIAAQPFTGLHVFRVTLQPPPDTGHVAGQLFGLAQVSFQITHRPGVSIQMTGHDTVIDGARQASLDLQITLDGASYQPAPRMPRQEYTPSISDLEDGAYLIATELLTSLANPFSDPITRANQIQALIRGVVTDAYDVPGVDLMDRNGAQPFVQLTQIPGGQGIIENDADDQPYPVYGWIELRWHRPDIIFTTP